MQKNSGLFLTLFGAVFLTVGLVMGYLSVRTVNEALSMRSWNEVEAHIVSSNLARHSGSKGGSTYKVEARYKYSVNGVSYTGDRVGLSGGSDNVGSFHQDQYHRLSTAKKRGESVPCWVNPENPAESILNRKPRPEMVAFKMMFALIFGAVGLGICMTGLISLLTPDTSAGDFQQSRIRMRGAHAHKVAVGVAVFWNFFTVWILFQLVSLLSPAETPLYFWGVGVSGLIPFSIALYLVLRINKYGVSYLELSPSPGVLGGPVTGNVRISKNVQVVDGFSLVLQCIHQYTTGSGKNSTTHKDVLWDSNSKVDMAYNYGDEMVVPVKFHAPYDKPATSAAGGSNGHYWQLKVKAKTPGIDYNAVFDVPVRRTAQSQESDTDDNIAEYSSTGNPQSFELAVRSQGLGYEMFDDNSYAVNFRAFRVPAAAVFLVIFLSFWSGACWFMAGKAPWFFVGIFMFFDVVIFSFLLTLLFGSSRLVVSEYKRNIRIEKRFAGFLYASRDIAFNDISNVDYEQGMQSGSSQYYRVVVGLMSGKRVAVGSLIRDRSCAKRIADELNRIST